MSDSIKEENLEASVSNQFKQFSAQNCEIFIENEHSAMSAGHIGYTKVRGEFPFR